MMDHSISWFGSQTPNTAVFINDAPVFVISWLLSHSVPFPKKWTREGRIRATHTRWMDPILDFINGVRDAHFLMLLFWGNSGSESLPTTTMYTSLFGCERVISRRLWIMLHNLHHTSIDELEGDITRQNVRVSLQQVDLNEPNLCSSRIRNTCKWKTK